MSELKCPVCGKNMVFIESDEGFDVFVCTNSKCKCSGYANESVWKYIDRTRKALDVAVDALKWISETFYLGEEFVAPVGERCEIALEQITALEQKD